MSDTNPNTVDHIARALYGAVFLLLSGSLGVLIWKGVKNGAIVHDIMQLLGVGVAFIVCYVIGYAIERSGVID